MQTLHHKKNELFEVEFYKDKECTETFDFKSEMTSYFKCNVNFENLGDPNNFYRYHNKGHYYIEFVNNDLTPLFYLPSDIQLFTPYIANIDKINGFLERKNIGIQSLDDITPNLSKYIPEDNAVLFLSEEECDKYSECFNTYFVYPQGLLPRVVSSEMDITDYKELTIFLPHGTQSEFQKANEVAKELKEKYGVEEVNLFALHCFAKNIDFTNCSYLWDLGSESNWNISKIITTNSTGILPVQNNERLQVIDCKKIFEEYLKTQR